MREAHSRIFQLSKRLGICLDLVLGLSTVNLKVQVNHAFPQLWFITFYLPFFYFLITLIHDPKESTLDH